LKQKHGENSENRPFLFWTILNYIINLLEKNTVKKVKPQFFIFEHFELYSKPFGQKNAKKSEIGFRTTFSATFRVLFASQILDSF